MKKIHIIFLPLIFLVLACEKYEGGYEIYDGYVHLQSDNEPIGAIGGEKKITIDASGNWEITRGGEWLEVLTAKGGATKGETIILRADTNKTGTLRNTTLKISSGSYSDQCTISQEGGKVPDLELKQYPSDEMKFKVSIKSSLVVDNVKIQRNVENNYNDFTNEVKVKVDRDSVKDQDSFYSITITGFTPGENYELRAGAHNPIGWGYSEPKKVSTNVDLSSFTRKDGKMAFVITPTSNLKLENVGICYNVNNKDDPESESPYIVAQTNNQNQNNQNQYEVAIESLDYNATYKVRAWAKIEGANMWLLSKKIIELPTGITFDVKKAEKDGDNYRITFEVSSQLKIDDMGVLYSEAKDNLVNNGKLANKADDGSYYIPIGNNKTLYARPFAHNASGKYYSDDFIEIDPSGIPGADDNPKPDKP